MSTNSEMIFDSWIVRRNQQKIVAREVHEGSVTSNGG